VYKRQVKVCPECKHCWEKEITSGYHSGTNQIRYTPGTLPTYGKERVVCKKCILESKEVIINEIIRNKKTKLGQNNI
jgi:hypothetical protein